MTETRTFVRALHGLRGIAVLYVLFSHLGLARLFLIPFIRYDHIGKMGVVIFFVLSAFLLTGKLRTELLQRGGTFGPIGTYLVHRFFRIYPLFAIVLALHVFVGHFDWYTSGLHLLLQRGFMELWAIPVEFKYYFCMPLVAWCAVWFGSRATLVLLLAGLIASFAYYFFDPSAPFDNDIALSGKLPPFLLGSMLALCLDDGTLEARGKRVLDNLWVGWTSLALLAASTLAFHMRHTEDLSDMWSPWIMLAIALAASGLIIASLRGGAISRVLSSRVLVFFGEISFSIYLLHEFIVGWVLRHLGMSRLLEAWVALVLVMGFAWLSYLCIERPGIRLGYRIGRWISETRANEKPG